MTSAPQPAIDGIEIMWGDRSMLWYVNYLVGTTSITTKFNASCTL